VVVEFRDAKLALSGSAGTTPPCCGKSGCWRR